MYKKPGILTGNVSCVARYALSLQCSVKCVNTTYHCLHCALNRVPVTKYFPQGVMVYPHLASVAVSGEAQKGPIGMHCDASKWGN